MNASSLTPDRAGGPRAAQRAAAAAASDGDAAVRRPAPAAVAALLCALLLGVLPLGAPAGAGAAPSGGPQASAAAAARFGAAVLSELNRVRAAHGIAPVAADRRIARIAAAHSRAMARRGTLAHGSWSGRVARAAGQPRAVGEVLGWLRRARPGREARALVRGWLRSPTHRSVVLDAGYRRVGIGRAPARLHGLRAALYTVDWATAR